MRNSFSPSLFTLEFINLPKNLDKQTMIADLWQHLEKCLNENKKSNENKKQNEKFTIVGIQLEEKNLVINLEDKKGKFVRKVNNLSFYIFK